MLVAGRGSSRHTSTLHVVGAAIVEAGKVLVAQRGPAMSLPLKWEFPGGKVLEGEEPRVALVREIREELALEIEVLELLGRGEAHADGGGRHILLDVYAATLRGGSPCAVEHAAVGWFTADELRTLDWAAADIPVVPAVERWLRELR
ncbi:MAG TPA: (deoxy)nucleoside triphosphate pyrophosphohydrolase [Thermoanaerobaculia bacterium]|nr:(deoxy)nucleoside triphosphate pyrophosphohydrolase [Thermoanaerobaculia bacterium]